MQIIYPIIAPINQRETGWIPHLIIHQSLITLFKTENRIINSISNRKWNYEYVQIIVKNQVSWSLTSKDMQLITIKLFDCNYLDILIILII